MYCTHCGKQIEDNSKFCPYCGGSLSSSNTGSAKEALKKTAGAVMDSAKAIGNSVNEATNGQAQKYAEKAKETAQSFVDDTKQVAKDKNTSNFLKKNKYRNLKIIIVLVLVIFFISSIFIDGGSDSNEQTAILAVEARIYQSYPSAKMSNAKVIEKDGYGRYLVSLDIEFSNESGYAIGVAVLYSDDNIDTAVYPYSDKSEKKSAINELKSISNWGKKISQ